MGQPHQILVQKFSKKGCGSNSKAICYIRFLTVFFTDLVMCSVRTRVLLWVKLWDRVSP